jgi:signal transduction histidine kinase
MTLVPRASLAGRVAVASGLAAALGGIIAAVAAGVTARELVATHEDESVRAAALELADEVDEESRDADEDPESDEHGDEPENGSLAALLAHELADVDMPGASAAIRRGSELLAGDPQLPTVASGKCEVFSEPSLLRVCAVSFQGEVLQLGVRAESEHERDRLLRHALLVGLLSGALFGSVFSYFIARWALKPLTQLRDRIRIVRADKPDSSGFMKHFSHVEVEELRVALAHLIARLGEALALAQRFSAEAAHELRTPLTTIGGELELLEEGEKSYDPAAIARVRAQVASLSALIERLLILANPGDIEPRHAETVEIADVVARVCEALPATSRVRIDLSVITDEVLPVHGDAALLQAMIGNAIDNALKFSIDKVNVRLIRQEREIWIEIADRGPGVPEREREHVFAAFYRTAHARASGAQGHGLGLALIGRVARSHGGDAEFLAVASGATLRIRLPLWRAHEAAAL